VISLTWFPDNIYTVFNYISDTESDKAARRQLKEAIHAALFDMNVPAVCAINQVLYVKNSIN
jgi:hypothetical protein